MRKFEITTDDTDQVATLEVYDDETPVRAIGTVAGITVDFAESSPSFDVDAFVDEVRATGATVTEVDP